MKKIVVIVVTAFLIGFYSGQHHERKETLKRKRALEIPEKDVFTNRDIEHILFNEPQL